MHKHLRIRLNSCIIIALVLILILSNAWAESIPRSGNEDETYLSEEQGRRCLDIANRIVFLAFTGGAATKRGTRVETSGFMGDYSQLKTGAIDDEALLYFVDESVEFK